jgi:lactate dehydrogenase-like 2-hydroxyacid dehydrogenase
MKQGVIIVNTSRGGVIDETAFIEAIESGKVSYAGLDVLDCLDIDYGKSALMGFPERVFVTPHIAWNSVDAVKSLQEKVALNVKAVLEGGKPNTYV